MLLSGKTISAFGTEDMVATIVNEAADCVTIQIVIPFHRSMLEAENAIQDALNQAGTLGVVTRISLTGVAATCDLEATSKSIGSLQ